MPKKSKKPKKAKKQTKKQKKPFGIELLKHQELEDLLDTITEDPNPGRQVYTQAMTLTSTHDTM